MKLSYLLPALLSASVSARRHRLCCCAGFNACNQFVFDGDSTGTIVAAWPDRYVRSTKSWDKNTGSPCGGLQNWMYAVDDGKNDDGLLGGTEISKLCSLDGLSSRCFSPKDYKNGSKRKVKERGEEIRERGVAKYPFTWSQHSPVVGGGERGKGKGTNGDKDHWGTYSPS
ncbi:hypothetical protein EG327_005963 [Venturia inaequalis]|uniref:Uncharacterized protein n=1 Tax=Venturia inaequalis TaxID=5025 RepID=A0A8H3V4T0_VENIN|nr:hypothetical protein EG327_005963 [Venturia inaequalis]